MSSSKQQYRKIRHDIIAMHNPLKGTISFFDSSNVATIKKYIPLLCKEDFFCKAITGTPFPPTLSTLDRCGTMPYFKDIEKTLWWYSAALRIGGEKINTFLSLKAEFDHAFLWGEYEKCLELLSKCHQQYGWSIWEIKNRIAVFNESQGIDGQKQYTQKVLSELQQGSVLYYLIYNFSKQCERNISFHTYQNIIHHDYNRFISGQVPMSLCKYAQYKANGYMFCSEENVDFKNYDLINFFLLMDDKEPLIDRYLSFCNIAANVFALNSEFCKYFIPCLSMLSGGITDPFLKNTIHLWKNHYCRFHPEGSDRICRALDFYAVGQYEKSRSIAHVLLEESIFFFPMVELYAKSCMYVSSFYPLVNGETMIDTILHKLWQLFSRKGDIIDIQANLLKIIYSHMDATWSKELLLIIERYNGQLTILEDIKTSNFYTAISLPSDIFLSPPEYLDDYLADTSSTYQNSLSTQFSIAVRKNNIDQIEALPIEPIRKGKYEANLLIKKDPDRALKILEALRDLPGVAPIQMEIDAMRVRANLQKSNIMQAMDILVPAFSENSNFIYIGYIDKIFEAIKSGRYNLHTSILTPIVCSLYFNYYPKHDDRDDVILGMCYDEYLAFCGVERPSELLDTPPVGVSNENFVRFLAEVCVPNVMDLSLAFTSYDEVLLERRDICYALIERDPSYAEKYAREIERLSKNLLISLAKREVENGKIYVDMEGIRTLLGKEVCESFERYVDFRENDLNDQVVYILNSINSNSESPEVSKTKIIYLRHEIKQIDMFQDILRRIRDIFVADNKYGLDGCLSVRIRHGTLESRLRSCFEKHKLITTKAPDGTYRKNEFWFTNGKKHPDKTESIDAIFSAFATQVDSIITFIKKELIQIRTEDKNLDGLFHFVIDGNFVERISAKTIQVNSFEEFEKIMLDEMLKMTDFSLERVRNTLKNEINTSFQNALKDLETNLQQHRNQSLNFRGLSDQIANARTDISMELQNISEWFHLTQPNSFSDYQPSLALSISYDTMQISHGGYVLNCDQSNIDEKIYLKGNTLPNFVDIFNILLDNVIKHSGFQHSASLKISVWREENCIYIRAENPIKPGCSAQSSRILELEALLSRWESEGYVNKEGGSGLHKIKKILSVDLKCKNTISISSEQDTFCVQISAELGEAIL